MFPSPIPKYIIDHPTYASWFDETSIAAHDTNGVYIEVMIQKLDTEVLFTSPILPWPEVLTQEFMVPPIPRKGCLLTLFYYHLIAGKIDFVGNVRVKITPGVRKTPTDLKSLLQPYRSSINKFRRLSRYPAERRTSVRRSGFVTSSPVRPNESGQGQFTSYQEGVDEAGVYHLSDDSVTSRTVYSRTWTGSRTPNFGRLKEEGNLPVNDHSVRIVKETGGVLLEHVTRTSSSVYYDFGNHHMSHHYGLPGASAHLANVSSKAFARLAKKVGSIEANLAQDLVQYQQVTNLIADHSRRLANAFRAVRRGNFPLALELLYHPSSKKYQRGRNTSVRQSTADNWLALQYGWKPLLMDIHGAVELISQQSKNNAGSLQKVVASASRKTESSSDFDIWGYPGYKAGSRDTVTRTSAKYYLMYRQSSTLLNYLQQTGFTNPLNLAWEVLPYSFVLDWLLPIGPWLETLSLWQGKEFVSGGFTQFTRSYTYQRVDYDTPISGSAFVVRGSGEYQRSEIILDRSRLTSFPVMELPKPKNPLSIIHALNALALLQSAFGRRKTRLFLS